MKLTPAQQTIVLQFKPIVERWVSRKFYGRLRDEKLSDAFMALCSAVARWQEEYEDPAFLAHLETEVLSQWRESYNTDRRHTRRRGVADLDSMPSGEASPEDKAAINESFGRLEEQDRRVLDWLLDGESAADIQKETGKSQSTVYRKINRVKKSWEKLFGE